MCQSAGAFRDGASYLGTSGSGSRIRWGGMALILLTMAGFSPAADARGDADARAPSAAEQIAAGQELFSREWKAGGLGWGDGLGPLYNAASCAQCHRLGGVGGAGANENNVDLLTVKVPRNVVVAGGDLRQRVAAFHPALAAGQLSATTVLHRFSTNADYDAWRKRFLSADEQAQLSLARIVAVATSASKHPVKATNAVQRLDGMAYQHSQRNTPALFGAGMIDRLPDSVFEELEQRQAAMTGKVRGRVPRAANGKVGRFGWRGQTESLHEFVLGACAVELGLEAPGRPQPVDPLRVRFDDSGRAHSPGRGALDITDEQCQSLTGFVAHLPPPQRMTPTDPAAAEMAARGEERFEKIGCADCHVPQVAEIAGIYSDLLLHDLGEGLEDPVPANPAQGTAGSASYYGGADSLLVTASPEQRREWRTPPLWGVRDNAPYLHDGRAQTFSEAIAWHGGQAARSARDFRRLPKDEREEIIAFLNCLTAPTPE
jgi:CxxC motif-containing protein (DUF1111 family)